MNWGRIWAVFLRYFYYFAKLDHLADLFYWPAIDIFLGDDRAFGSRSKKGECPTLP